MNLIHCPELLSGHYVKLCVNNVGFSGRKTLIAERHWSEKILICKDTDLQRHWSTKRLISKDTDLQRHWSAKTLICKDPDLNEKHLMKKLYWKSCNEVQKACYFVLWVEKQPKYCQLSDLSFRKYFKRLYQWDCVWQLHLMSWGTKSKRGEEIKARSILYTPAWVIA